MRASELRVVAGGHRGAGAPTVFHAEVRADGAASEASRGSRLEARVTLELRGDAIEYRLRLQNPAAEVVTEAWITLRNDGERSGPGAPVVQLFSDGRIRDRFLELRGSTSTLASMRAAAIAEELQARPEAFSVLLLGAGPSDQWIGPVMVGR